jgi:hypothetical protein
MKLAITIRLKRTMMASRVERSFMGASRKNRMKFMIDL